MALPVKVNASVLFALAQLLSITVNEQPNVGEGWQVPAKGVVQFDVFGGGNKPLLPPVSAWYF